MQAPLFIRIENTFEQAMYFRRSADMIDGSLYFAGVQLLPYNLQPYRHITKSVEGIELEEYTVTVKDMCRNTIGDITDYFTVVNAFMDEDGVPQIEWTLTNVQADFGEQMIYLEIQQLPSGSIYYSSPFMLTNEQSEYTSRWDYCNDLQTDVTLSTQLQIFWMDNLDIENINSYSPVQGRLQRSYSNVTDVERWQTKPIFNELFRLIKQMRTNVYVYSDGQRTQPYEAFETPQRQGGENMAQQFMLLSRDPYDTYDPLYVPVVPVPPTPTYVINLLSVTPINNNQVQLEFNYSGFETTYLQMQYSLDGITWFGSTGSNVSPRILNTAGNIYTNNYYYRVWFAPLELPSNVIQLPVEGLVITNVQSISGNKYAIYYNTNGFTQTESVVAEVSTNGTVWQDPIQSGVIQNPKLVLVPSGGMYTFFRLRYSPLGLISNVFEI